MNKSFYELIQFETFDDRFNYLKLSGGVGEETFGFERYFNQIFYRSREWKYVRKDVIIRDNGCDLGVPGHEIYSNLLVHHINPVTLEDIEQGRDCLLDLNNLITTTLTTHNALHFGDLSQIPRLPEERTMNDTCLWGRRKGSKYVR
jgi:hypothetical protein